MKVCGLIVYYTGMIIRVAGRHIVNQICEVFREIPPGSISTSEAAEILNSLAGV